VTKFKSVTFVGHLIHLLCLTNVFEEKASVFVMFRPICPSLLFH
jgi:hypothetical protein